MAVTPAPISAGVLGMQRTRSRCPPSHLDKSASRVPAAIDTTRLPEKAGGAGAAAARPVSARGSPSGRVAAGAAESILAAQAEQQHPAQRRSWSPPPKR